MASLQDILTSAYINLISVITFLLGFAFLRLQPVNNRVYFAKCYKMGKMSSPKGSNMFNKFVNLDPRTYLMFWTWMPEALQMPDRDLIDYAGLDSVAHIQIYLLGLQIFIPIGVLALAILVPVNLTGETLKTISNLTYSNIDKLSISNVPAGSFRLLAHILMAYVVTFWTCYVLHKEYKHIAHMRLLFIASELRRPDQFTVLVRNIPPDIKLSVNDQVQHFFLENHPEHYLTHQVVYNANMLHKLVQEKRRLRSWLTYYETVFERNPRIRPQTKTGFMGIFGDVVDAIDYYKAGLEWTIQAEDAEKDKVMRDPKSIIPAAFVSFKSRWGAAVCAQTQQAYNPTHWLTEWASEPRDVCWENLSIRYVRRSFNRMFSIMSMFFLTFFFMIPIAFVQSLASIDGLQNGYEFLKPLFKSEFVKSIVQGYLPGIALKIFMLLLPSILKAMSKLEGHTCHSALDRRTAGKFHFFILVNVFFGSIITGAAFQQLEKFLHQSTSKVPKTLGVAMPMKATFFITYIMVDGWSAVASEIIRISPLVKFHLKRAFLAKTELDRELAMEPSTLDFATSEPQIQLYFLLGLVYSVVSPLILPFILVFFAFSYMIFRHQVINVYVQKYESGASFWPDVHFRVIVGLLLSQVLLMGLLSTKSAAMSTPFLLVLPVFTIWFHHYCKERFKPAFVKFPIREAMKKDTIERTNEPNLDLRAYLGEAYIHPGMRDMLFACR